MALGKPVIAYDMVENRVSAGDAGLYARPSEPRDLARQLMTLIENPQLRYRLGRLGQTRIRAELAWEFSADALVGLYASDTFRYVINTENWDREKNHERYRIN
jgi:glycosyltransferase involved in cell wall biosynthesis